MRFLRLAVYYSMYFFLIFILGSCQNNIETRKDYDIKKNLVDVRNKIKAIDLEKEISLWGTPYILNDYLIISDYMSPDRLIHLFNKHTFKYITSVGDKGTGPNEIANLGKIVSDKKENQFLVIDHGKKKILSFKLDSILVNPFYSPEEKTVMNEREFPDNFQYINDTLAFSLFINMMDNGDYKPVAAKWNLQNGEVQFMNYKGHPDIKRKRVSFVSSEKNGVYVEAYWYHDLMSICTLDGNLKYNLYGSSWDNRNSNENQYFDHVTFYKDKIMATYLGGKRFEKHDKVVRSIYPDKLVVFDCEGNYISTLLLGSPIINLCCDEEGDRLYFLFNGEPQFGYMDLKEVF